MPTLAIFGTNSYSLDIEADYEGYKDSAVRIENTHRVRDGGLYIYKWGGFDKINLPVSFVNSSYQAIVNSWWDSGAALVYTNGTDVSSVYVRNKSKPIDTLMKPYDDQFKGVIILESY